MSNHLGPQPLGVETPGHQLGRQFGGYIPVLKRIEQPKEAPTAAAPSSPPNDPPDEPPTPKVPNKSKGPNKPPTGGLIKGTRNKLR